MSSSFEDKKKCSKYEKVQTMKNFYKDKSTKDYLNPICIFCKKFYYNENHNRFDEYQIEHNKENWAKMKIYEKQIREVDFNFNVTHNIRIRSNPAYEAQDVSKTISNFDFLGCSSSFSKIWILHQLYSEMTVEKLASIWQLDHCYPL